MSDKDFTIMEGISGTFFYHIAKDGKTLCGKKPYEVMTTRIPLSAWGVKSHLNERYCQQCEEAFKQK